MPLERVRVLTTRALGVIARPVSAGWVGAPAAALLCSLALAAPVAAQTPDKQDEILNELRQIRQLLERLVAQQPAPRPQAPPQDERVKLPTLSGYTLGRPDAPVTIVEFTDLQCPFCRSFHVATFPEIKKAYIDTGKARFVTKDFPLDFHPFARKAAILARCAGEQGKFWELRDALATNADKLSDETMNGFARELKLDMKKLQACVEGQAAQAEVQKDLQEGVAAGVSGTPTFVIGATSATAMDGVRLVGAQPLALFQGRIEQVLGAAAKAVPTAAR